MGNRKHEDEPRTGRPIDDELMQATVEENPVVIVEELAEKLGLTHSTVHRHLQLIGKIPKLGKWVLHELSVPNLQQRVNLSRLI